MSTPDVSPTPASPAAVDRENPWPGLGSYDESMHGFFFGRDAEVEELLRLVRRDPVALFYGQSGLGKSSLLQAGLFPRLRAADLMPVHIRLRFGAGFPHPVAQILQEVATAARLAGGEAPAAPEGVSLFEYFYDETHEFWSARNRVLTPVIVFDQFEEIFTLGARDPAATAQRDELLTQLADLAARRAPDALVARFEQHPELASSYALDRTRCRLLFSLREDFLPELGSLRDHLPTLASGGLRLQRLRGHQAREVLEKPGAHLLDPDTTERIIRFVAAERTSGGAHELSELEVEPALLNVVARELNNRRRARGLDRISADLAQGARNEILVDFYERAFTGLEPQVREFVEDQLLTTTGFRDSVAVEDAEASYRVSRDVLAVLVDRRLLRIDERFQMQRVELTHDLLAGVVKASRDSRREREAADAGRRRVEEARRAAEQAAAEAQAKLRHTRTRALIGTVMAVLAVGVGGLIYLNQRKAGEARRLDAERAAAIEARLAADVAREEARTNLQRANEAMAGSLLVQADAALATGGFDAAQLLLRMGQDHGIFPAGSLAWFSAPLNQPRVLALEGFVRLGQPAVQVDFAPGGRLVVVNADGAVRIAALPGTPPGTIELHPLAGALGQVADATCVEVLWDEVTLVAVGTRARTVQLFELESGAALRLLRAPDRQALAAPTTAGSSGGTSAKEDASASASAPTRESADAVESVRFAPHGRSLAAITSDGLLTTWQLAGSATWRPDLAAAGPDAELITSSSGTGNLDSDSPVPSLTTLSWAVDGSLVASTAEASAWFTKPSAAWSSELPIEYFSMPALRGAVRASADGRGSEWFVANSTDSRLHWLRLPADSAAESAASQVRATEALPDTVHSVAAMPGADVIFVAMRNGSIAICRSDLTTAQPSLRVLQTTAAGRSRHIDLRLRPDGQFLAAISDDGSVCLYRVSIPPALTGAVQDQGGLMRHDGTWLHRRGDGSITRADGSTVAAWPHRAPDDTTVRAVHLPGVASARDALAFVTRRGTGDDEPARCGVLQLESGAWLWSRPAHTLGRTTEETLSAAAFSPDGAQLAVPTADGRILRLAARTGEPAGPDLIFAGELQRIAWSGDGRRLAVTNNLQEIAVFEPASGDRSVATLHARHSRLGGFTLDGPGHTLVYATTDARLVLERFAPGERRASLAVPLPAPASSVGIAEGAGGQPPSIATIIQGRMQVFSGSLPTEAQLEWANLATVDGYDSAAFAPATSITTRLSESWLDDSVTLAAARLLRDTFTWIGTASAQFSDAIAAGSTPADLERLRLTGEDLRGRFEVLAPRQPAFAAFEVRLASATADLVTFSREIAPNLTALQRWPIVAYQHSIAPESDVATSFAAEHAMPLVVAELKARSDTSPALPPGTQAQYQEIVHLAVHSGRVDNAIWEARDALRAHLYSNDQWLTLIFGCPSAFLIDREANAQAAQDRETSNRLYLELERREPDALTYPIRRGNNLRKMNRQQEALDLFDRVAAKAAEMGNGEIEAEARIYRAWTFQETEGRLPDARADMVAAARLAPADPWTLRNAIEFFLAQNSPADAVEPATHLVEAEDTPATRMLQARVLLAVGDGAAARAAVEPLAGSDDIPARLDIVELFAADPAYANHLFAAEWAYAAYQATSDTKLEDRALRDLGPLWLDLDDLVRARNALDKLFDYKLTLEEQALVRAFQGRIDMRRRDLVRARESFDTSLRLEPEPPARVRRDYAHFLEWSGDADGALAQFAAASEAGGAADALAHVLAVRRLGSRTSAERALESALARFPGDPGLRLEHARSLLEIDPALAQRELATLDDGSLTQTALLAAAFLGRAAEAAERNLPALVDAFAGEHVNQAVLHGLAYSQTREPAQRAAALHELSTAIDRGYRGDVHLLATPGLESVAEDPLVQLAAAALAAEDRSRDGLLALARFNLRVAALITHQDTKSLLLARAQSCLRNGVELEVFTPADVLADPELAPFAGQF